MVFFFQIKVGYEYDDQSPYCLIKHDLDDHLQDKVAEVETKRLTIYDDHQFLSGQSLPKLTSFDTS